jgi:hypothetical protein
VPCLAHRILPTGGSGLGLDAHGRAMEILEAILEEVAAPL